MLLHMDEIFENQMRCEVIGGAGISFDNKGGGEKNTNNARGDREVDLYSGSVEAGFPSPADDYLEGGLDLHEHLVKRPASTFFVRVSGCSMEGVGIFSGDMLVVDRSLDAKDGDVVLAVLSGEMTVKRLLIKDDQVWLAPSNDRFKPMLVTEDVDFQIWGVCCHVVHEL